MSLAPRCPHWVPVSAAPGKAPLGEGGGKANLISVGERGLVELVHLVWDPHGTLLPLADGLLGALEDVKAGGERGERRGGKRG